MELEAVTDDKSQDVVVKARLALQAALELLEYCRIVL